MKSFEFNDSKSQGNLRMHDIDFHTAQELWEDPNLVEIEGKATDEPRYLVIAMIDTTVWSAVITYRNDLIRIISVRRARKTEVTLYES